MSIGIYDADLYTYTLVPFNLTAMKWSAYYKKKRELVVLAPEFDIGRNTQYIFVKDWNDGNFPLELRNPKVQYYGHAFSGNQYIALDEEVELMPADNYLYESAKPWMLRNNDNFSKNIFNEMINAAHGRLSLDNKSVWSNYEKQFHDLHGTSTIMLHDYNLGQIDGAWEAVQHLIECGTVKKRQPRIGMKFPIILSDGHELLKWSSIRPSPIFYSVRYDGIIDNQIFRDWAANGNYKNAYTQLEYNITANITDEQDLVSQLLEIYYQVLISRSYRLKMSLKYDTDKITNPLLQKTLDLFNYYQHSMLSGFSDDAFIREVQDDTLFDFAKKTVNSTKKYNHYLTKTEIKQIFHYIGEQSPDLFKAFYELTAKDLLGGSYDVDRNQTEN